MSGFRLPAFETLESRQLLAASVYSSAVTTIGATSGVTASAVNPRTTGVVVDGGTSAAHRDTAIQLSIVLGSGGGVKETSLKKGQFAIFEVGTTTAIATSNVQTSGGGDVLIVKPTTLLKANTDYRIDFNLRNDLTPITDIGGNPFDSATYTFHTGTFFNQPDPVIKFDKQTVSSKTSNGAYSAITIGPDGKLYAATLSGHIYRWTIASDGTLAGESQITLVRDNNGGARFITGLTFDPRSTAANPVLWVSHGQAKFGDSTSDYASNYTGKISRIYNNFSTYEDVIVNIPRSVKDHLNNQISFDPLMRNLYFVIPSQSAMGRADSTWGNRAEEVSTAALFRLQLQTRGTKVGIEDWLAASGPINLDPNATKPYNFFKGTNPLRFFATGIRNAYDMVWHTNGHLYVPSNGSAAGGNTPEDPNQTGTQQISSVQQTIDDYLYDVVETGYYGSPNPTRNEWILQGGNPTGATDPFQVSPYPVGTQPDANYRGAAFSFGKNQSPNGVIEYKSNAFGGRLKGSLVVARYSSGDDLAVVTPNADGTFTQSSAEKLGITGFTGYENPLDLVEDTRNGNIYVASLVDRFGKGSIQLLKPQLGSASVSKSRLVIAATPGDTNGATKQVTLTNTASTGALSVDVSAIRITGLDRKSFVVTDFPTADFVLQPGQTRVFTVKYVARAGDTSIRYGNLAIATDDPTKLYTIVQLRGTALGVTASAFRPSVPSTSSVFSTGGTVLDTDSDLLNLL